jgi:asparagine synthase (glutamine-hydrolysing)
MRAAKALAVRRPFRVPPQVRGFLRLTAAERALSWPDEAAPVELVDGDEEPLGSPIEVFRSIIEPHVLSGPCYVLFSGGRDSSAVLAVATAIAREAGVANPIPVTGVHPTVPDADEDAWQELVLEHLAITDRVVFEFRGEQSLLAPAAQDSLRANGLLWPPAIHVQAPFVQGLDGGSLLSGEGGDGVITARRLTALIYALRARRHRASLRELGRLMASRRELAESRRSFLAISPWLTAEGRRLAEDAMARTRSEPVRSDAGLLTSAFSRPAQMARTNFLQFFRGLGFDAEDPLDHPRFVGAVARAGGWLGIGSRTDMMRYLFRDYLPDQVLSRQSKAAFNAARWTPREVAFARSWSGLGVDRRFIDPDRLRDSWLTESSVLSDLQLHAAWLADNGLPLEP